MDIETISLKHRQVRSAIALSNVGVRLLELQCYAQAVDCLNEATILVGANGGSTGEDAVNRCLRHLSSPRPATKQVLLFEVLTATPDGFEQGDASALESVLDGAPSSFIGFPVRLEDSTNVAAKAILAHNHGIACHCLSRTLQRRSSARRIFSSSAKQSVQEACRGFQQLLACKSTLELYCLAIAALNSSVYVNQASSDESYEILVQLREQAMAMKGANLLCAILSASPAHDAKQVSAAAA